MTSPAIAAAFLNSSAQTPYEGNPETTDRENSSRKGSLSR
jgi:hypothetical protein